MKGIIAYIIFFFGFFGGKLYSQTNGLLSQYMFNRLMINPAYAGSEDALSLTFLCKKQWSEINGSPSSQIFSLHSPLKSNKIALGLTLLNDQMGNLNQKGIYGAYSYKIQFDNSVLALGLQAGLTWYHSDFSNLPINHKEDPVFIDSYFSGNEPSFGSGLFYSGSNHYLGISVPQLLKLNTEEIYSNTLQARNYFFHGGYTFRLNDELKLNPTFLCMFKGLNKTELNLNINLLIMDVIWGGILYRNLETLSFLSKIHLNKQLQLGYACDLMTGRLATLAKTSHEFMLKYRFVYEEKKIVSPRYF